MPAVIFPGPEGRLEGRFQPAPRPRATPRPRPHLDEITDALPELTLPEEPHVPVISTDAPKIQVIE